jgi:LysM repeat protein
MKNIFASALFAALILMPASGALAQQSDARRISDLEQDVQSLKEKVGELSIQLENLARVNEQLRDQLAKSSQTNAGNLVTLTQLDAQLANLRTEMMRAQATQKNEIIDEVGRQIERLAQQTQQAIQSQPPAPAPAPAPAASAANFPKTGVSYTVQKGDTLSAIARRFNASMDDIRNANNITDPTKIRVGQVLFIPQKAK